jgi:hypothetical protein
LANRYPNQARSWIHSIGFTYRYAHDDRGVGTAEWIADVYGGDPNDLVSVDRAYASFSSGPRRRTGFLGWLDALKAYQESGG